MAIFRAFRFCPARHRPTILRETVVLSTDRSCCHTGSSRSPLRCSPCPRVAGYPSWLASAGLSVPRCAVWHSQSAGYAQTPLAVQPWGFCAAETISFPSLCCTCSQTVKIDEYDDIFLSAVSMVGGDDNDILEYLSHRPDRCIRFISQPFDLGPSSKRRWSLTFHPSESFLPAAS